MNRLRSNNRIYLLMAILIILFSGCRNNETEPKDNSGWFSDEVEQPATDDAVAAFLQDTVNNVLYHRKEVVDFYQDRKNNPVWNDIEIRNDLLSELQKAGEEGLSFEDYHGRQLTNLINSTQLSQKQRAITEVLLTDAFLKYGGHLFYGKLDPRELYQIWGTRREVVDLGKVLRQAVEDGEISDALNGLKPGGWVYSGLKASLAEYAKLKQKKVQVIKIPEGKHIEPGKGDERIRTVAARLQQLGLLEKGYQVTDNIYNEKLQAAVMQFQTTRGLATDKILGNSTIAELNMSLQDRYDQILANLERWRWYPRDLGEHYILINIPDFKLAVVKDGDTVRRHNVIAGTKYNRTPVFSDTIAYIVINPVWNIPVSIRNNEIIPLAANDPGYLQSRNIFITGPDGKRVDPRSVDWSEDQVRTYRFTQGSGASNALGRIKIIYPNRYSIYLHDTPAKAVFAQNARAESHGCVRVQDAVELASYVVDDQEQWNLETIQGTIASGKTKQVPVKKTILVHHFYWTAWRDNGKTVFTNDVYGLDKELIKALEEQQ